MYFALYGKKKLLGIFDDYEKCTLTIQGIVGNNFLKNSDINVVSYYPNTITKRNELFLCSKIDTNDIIEDFTSECSTLNILQETENYDNSDNYDDDDDDNDDNDDDDNDDDDNDDEDDVIEEDSEERENRIEKEKKIKNKKEK